MKYIEGAIFLQLDFFEAMFIFMWYYVWLGVLACAAAGALRLLRWWVSR